MHYTKGAKTIWSALRLYSPTKFGDIRMGAGVERLEYIGRLYSVKLLDGTSTLYIWDEEGQIKELQ